MILIGDWWQSIYDFYQKYKNKCFLSDLAIQNQLSAIQQSNTYNQEYVARLSAEDVFTKDSVATLVGWYDAAADYITKDAGDNVTGWVDRSDAGNHLDTTPALKPVWYTSVVNGLPGVYSTGAGEYIRKTTFTNMGTDFTVFMVMKPMNIGSGTYQTFLQLHTTPDFSFVKYSGGTACAIWNGAVLYGETLLTNRTDLWTLIFDGASSSIRRNNNTPSTGNAGSSYSTNQICFFRDYNGTYYYQGYIAEVLCYSDVLSSANQEIVRQYLNNKYHIY